MFCFIYFGIIFPFDFNMWYNYDTPPKFLSAGKTEIEDKKYNILPVPHRWNYKRKRRFK